jgi:hypothetical protein
MTPHNILKMGKLYKWKSRNFWGRRREWLFLFWVIMVILCLSTI